MFDIYRKDYKYYQIPQGATPLEGSEYVNFSSMEDHYVFLNEARIEEIKMLLNQIDLKSIRPLREGNTELLNQYEAEAEALRVELRALLAV